MDKDQLKSILTLLMVPGIGHILAKNLIAYSGSPGAVFKEKRSHLEKIPLIGRETAGNILRFNSHHRVEQELRFIEKMNIKPLYYLNDDYPARLRDIDSAPVLLFQKGSINPNHHRMVGVVGTRKATPYGRDITRRIVEGLASCNVCIVSGLAYGIDYHAHSTAMQHGMSTAGVLGHGLDRIYPAHHKLLATRMLDQGGLFTEFFSGTNPDKENFPERNRIVASMVDALVVIESARKGGALITARIAGSYNREVFAVPGKYTDEYSSGCNRLIKYGDAILVEDAYDIIRNMGWKEQDERINRRSQEITLPAQLTTDEFMLINLLQGKESVHIDAIRHQITDKSVNIPAMLLTLELKGLIQSEPGNFYRII